MKRLLIVSFIIMCAYSGCSVFDDEQSDDPVEAVVYDEQLVIKNNLPYDVFFFAVDQNSLPFIFWAPTVGDENRIHTGSQTSISLSQLFPLQESGTIVIFYWDEEVNEIFNIEIEE